MGEQARAYLDEVSAGLNLPESAAHEVRDELAGHLADTTEDLIAAGLSPEEAEREALARLGPPSILAGDLRRARQTRRRLLAGAAGGVWAAVGHGIGGTILGFGLVMAILYPLLIVGGLVTLRLHLDIHTDDTIPYQSWNTILTSAALAIGAFLSGRRAVQAASARSQRTLRSLGRWWAIAGAAILTFWLLFVFQTALSWPAVAGELCIPVAFAAGATVRIDRRGPRVRARHIVLVFAVAFLGPILLFSAAGVQTASPGQSGGGSFGSQDEMWHAFGWDRIGKPPPDAIAEAFTGGSWLGSTGVLAPSANVTSPAAIEGWHAFRFEAWRRERDGGALAASATAPFVTAPATLTGSTFRGNMRVDRTPGVVDYSLVLTGLGPDGNRYLLQMLDGGQTAFTGTIWDWLTAQ